MVEAPDSKVYKVHAFDHWDNLDETPRLMHYTGLSYSMYNETSNCILALRDDARDEYIGEQCMDLDGEGPALNQWETIVNTDEIEKFANRSQVVKTLTHNYIYCFPGNIQIDGKDYKCPMEVFRLKTSHEFKTSKQRHIPTLLSVNATQKDIAVDAVHAGHFQEDSDVIQHLAMFEQLRQERRKLYNLTDEYKNSVVINKSSNWLWAGATVWISSTGFTITYWIVVCILRRRRARAQVRRRAAATAPSSLAPPDFGSSFIGSEYVHLSKN